MPPGSATNASERSNIICLRSCMPRVTTISVAPRNMFSLTVRNSGMMPMISPPRACMALAMAPISPAEPPP
jgi:hypothetical protein